MKRIFDILLLDGRVLRVISKNQNCRVSELQQMICDSLGVEGIENVGLMYTDIRGSRNWLRLNSFIHEHNFCAEGEIIQLVMRLRYVPHVVNKKIENIQLLYLTGLRLLKNSWFQVIPDIEAQLWALHILSTNVQELSDLNIRDQLISSLPVTTNGCTTTLSKSLHLYYNDTEYMLNQVKKVTHAYRIYQQRLISMGSAILKFIQLLFQIPLFTSQLFVVKNFNQEKHILGISSQYLTLFTLTRSHEPFLKVRIKDIDRLMYRNIKIIITLKTYRSHSTDRILTNSARGTLSQNCNSLPDKICIYAMTPYQAKCLYNELTNFKNFQKKYQSPLIRISDLMNDQNFMEKLKQINNMPFLENINKVSQNFSISVVHESNYDLTDMGKEFGETNLSYSPLYEMLYEDDENKYVATVSGMNVPDIQPSRKWMIKEKEKLEKLLSVKMEQLNENFKQEKEITGKTPPDHFYTLSRGTPKFTRKERPNNSQDNNFSLHQWEGGDTLSKYSSAVSSKVNTGSDSPSIYGPYNTVKTYRKDRLQVKNYDWKMRGAVNKKLTTSNSAVNFRSLSSTNINQSPKSADHYYSRHKQNASYNLSHHSSREVIGNQSPITWTHNNHENYANELKVKPAIISSSSQDVLRESFKSESSISNDDNYTLQGDLV